MFVILLKYGSTLQRLSSDVLLLHSSIHFVILNYLSVKSIIQSLQFSNLLVQVLQLLLLLLILNQKQFLCFLCLYLLLYKLFLYKFYFKILLIIQLLQLRNPLNQLLILLVQSIINLLLQFFHLNIVINLNKSLIKRIYLFGKLVFFILQYFYLLLLFHYKLTLLCL